MSRSPMPKPIPTIHLPVAASDEPSLFDLDGGGTIEADGASSACLGGASGTGAGLGGGVTCGVDSPAGLPSSTSETSVERPEKPRSEEHTSELQSLMRISYAVFCLQKKNAILTITRK